MADEIIDFLVEVLFDSLVDITVSVIPENKHSEKLEKVLSVFVVILTFVFLILFIVGICMIGETDGASVLGKVLICLLPAQVVTSVVLYIVKKLKEKKK